MPLVDCHALVFASDRERYPFATDAAPLQPGELDACTEAGALGEALARGAVSSAVLVQRNRFYGFDNALICDLAARDPRLRALVSVDSRTSESEAQARRLLALPGVAGVRLMEPEKGAGLDWLAGEHARALWSAVADAGAIIDVHVFPWIRAEALSLLAGLLRDFTPVPVLLDNLGNGPSEEDALDAAVAPLIEQPQLILKFSEMTLGRVGRAELDLPATIGAIARRVGADRLVWGSDILPPGCSLAEAARRAAVATADLGGRQSQAILFGNAGRLFGFS